jgi:prepilin-type N-terminal cleavage/methylation domain-containing protein
MSPRSSRGFTVIELVVVIGILGVLAALLLPAVTHIRDRGQEVAARKQMERLAGAVVAYLDRYPRLGPEDGGADFAARPWFYLHRAPVAAGDQPFAEMPASQRAGDAIRDPRTGGASAFVWRIDNRRVAPASPRSYTGRVAIVSEAGTTAVDDDLSYTLITHADPAHPEDIPGSWRWQRGDED